MTWFAITKELTRSNNTQKCYAWGLVTVNHSGYICLAKF